MNWKNMEIDLDGLIREKYKPLKNYILNPH